MEPAQYRELLQPLFTGGKVVCVGEMTAHFTPTAALALSLGAESVLVIGTGGYGMGSQPEGAAVIALDSAPAGSMLDGIRYHLALMHNPPARVLEALRRFDPDRSALVLGDLLEHRRPDRRPTLPRLPPPRGARARGQDPRRWVVGSRWSCQSTRARRGRNGRRGTTGRRRPRRRAGHRLGRGCIRGVQWWR